MTQIVGRHAVIIKDRHNKAPRTARRKQPLIVCLISAGSSVRVAPSWHQSFASRVQSASNLLPIEQKISSRLPRPGQCCIKAAANFQCNQYSRCVFGAALCLSLLYFLRGHSECFSPPSVSCLFPGWAGLRPGSFYTPAAHLLMIVHTCLRL